jgi:hypothetical protein
MEDAVLQTVWQQRQRPVGYQPLSASMDVLVGKTLIKRVKQVASLVDIWEDVIPEPLLGHTALQSFKSGVLTVMVDSSSFRFQLQQLLNGGLVKQLQERCSEPLNKVRLVPGQF